MSSRGTVTHRTSANGSIIKHADRVERINVKHPKRINLECHTWMVSRFVRRDLNLVSAKLYFMWRNAEHREAIMDALWEVDKEARRLEETARKYEMPGAEFHDAIPLRIISRQSNMLVEALKTADRALYKLRANMGDDLFVKDSPPFFKALARLKNTVLQPNSDAAQRQPEKSFALRLVNKIRRIYYQFRVVLRR